MNYYFIPSSNPFGAIDDEIFRFAQAYGCKILFMNCRDEPVRIIQINNQYYHIDLEENDEIHIYQHPEDSKPYGQPYIANRQTLFTLLFKLKEEIK